MKKPKLTRKQIVDYTHYLYGEEKSRATIEKYNRDIQNLYAFLPADKVLTKEILVAYKNDLIAKGYKSSSINSMIIAVNGILSYLNLTCFKLKLRKVQRRLFYEDDKELTKEEYMRLLKATYNKRNYKLNILLQTICSTGIRVSKHRFISVESLKDKRVIINNKGKTRMIFITKQLAVLLKDYCQKENIKKGPIFVTKGGKPIDRSNIWTAMKKLCEEANVSSNKVFPHNLRHLFALTYYRIQKDIVRLADILGHTSVDTTRIYTMTSGLEYKHSLAKMNLVIKRISFKNHTLFDSILSKKKINFML